MYGLVMTSRVPMWLGFEENDVEMICEALYDSLERSYNVISFFDAVEEDPWEE